MIIEYWILYPSVNSPWFYPSDPLLNENNLWTTDRVNASDGLCYNSMPHTDLLDGPGHSNYNMLLVLAGQKQHAYKLHILDAFVRSSVSFLDPHALFPSAVRRVDTASFDVDWHRQHHSNSKNGKTWTIPPWIIEYVFWWRRGAAFLRLFGTYSLHQMNWISMWFWARIRCINFIIIIKKNVEQYFTLVKWLRLLNEY